MRKGRFNNGVVIGVAGGILLMGQGVLFSQIVGLREDMREDISNVREDISDVREDISELRVDLANLDVRVGRLEGLLKGLRGHNRAARPTETHETLESVAAAVGSRREGPEPEGTSARATPPSGIR